MDHVPPVSQTINTHLVVHLLILFFWGGLRRHADRTVQLWMQRLKDSSGTKRLSLMYLANGTQLLEFNLRDVPI
jgi:hypothetical protein